MVFNHPGKFKDWDYVEEIEILYDWSDSCHILNIEYI